MQWQSSVFERAQTTVLQLAERFEEEEDQADSESARQKFCSEHRAHFLEVARKNMRAQKTNSSAAAKTVLALLRLRPPLPLTEYLQTFEELFGNRELTETLFTTLLKHDSILPDSSLYHRLAHLAERIVLISDGAADTVDAKLSALLRTLDPSRKASKSADLIHFAKTYTLFARLYF